MAAPPTGRRPGGEGAAPHPRAAAAPRRAPVALRVHGPCPLGVAGRSQSRSPWARSVQGHRVLISRAARHGGPQGRVVQHGAGENDRPRRRVGQRQVHGRCAAVPALRPLS
ncbi:unnamed protein product, partial [Prorocentrum cordatum]